MKSHMMAAVLYGKEHLQVEPVAVPSIDRGDILVRVKAALTCGTEVKVFRRGYHARMIVPPAVFGHELAGDVVAVGQDVTAFRPGQRVVAAQPAQHVANALLTPANQFVEGAVVTTHGQCHDDVFRRIFEPAARVTRRGVRHASVWWNATPATQ